MRSQKNGIDLKQRNKKSLAKILQNLLFKYSLRTIGKNRKHEFKYLLLCNEGVIMKSDQNRKSIIFYLDDEVLKYCRKQRHGKVFLSLATDPVKDKDMQSKLKNCLYNDPQFTYLLLSHCNPSQLNQFFAMYPPPGKEELGQIKPASLVLLAPSQLKNLSQEQRERVATTILRYKQDNIGMRDSLLASFNGSLPKDEATQWMNEKLVKILATKFTDGTKTLQPFVNFTDANLVKIHLGHADFTHVIAIGADFTDSNLKYVYFSQNNLNHANFTNAKILSSNFNYANLANSNFSNATVNFSQFEHTNLNYVNFFNSTLKFASFETADVSFADFSNSKLWHANFSNNQNFSGTNFTNADLSSAIFENANVSGATFINCILKETNFNGATFDGAKFIDKDWTTIGVMEILDNLKEHIYDKVDEKTQKNFRDALLTDILIYVATNDDKLSSIGLVHLRENLLTHDMFKEHRDLRKKLGVFSVGQTGSQKDIQNFINP